MNDASATDNKSLSPAHPTAMQRFSVSGSNFEIDQKYQPIKQIGTGAYGVVIAANDTENGNCYRIRAMALTLIFQAEKSPSKKYIGHLKT